MHDLVTFGETMASLRSTRPTELGGDVALSIAGSESNVAIGLARLGHASAWAGIVGEDRLGSLILRTLRAEGVDITGAARSSAPTGIVVFEERLPGVTNVDYHRSGSAGSRLDRAHAEKVLARPCRILHLTGITPALSPGAADSVLHAAHVAHASGVTISLDINYRARLWSREDARRALAPVIRLADIVVASDDEIGLAGPAGDASPVDLIGSGVREVVLKHGAAGATAVTADGSITVAAKSAVSIDAVGAGDAFVAGYLSGELDGLDLRGRLERGVTLGAFAVSTRGDWEGLPDRASLGLLTSESGTTIR